MITLSKVMLGSLLDEIFRESCSDWLICNTLPTPINKLALANPCVKIWNKDNTRFPREIPTNINPNCLSVDRATIFLESSSIRAPKLATIKVIIPNHRHVEILMVVFCINRTRTHTPAVTRVEL
jgi:hypothetical protein